MTRATSWVPRRVSLTNEDHIVPAALAGDNWTLTLIRESVQPLAKALWTCVSFAGVQQIILVGGFATALGDVYLDMLNEELLDATDFGLFRSAAEGLVVSGDNQDIASLVGAHFYTTRSA